MTTPRSIPLSALELSAAMRAALPYDANAPRPRAARRRAPRPGRGAGGHALESARRRAAPRRRAQRAASVRTTLPTVGESLAHNAAGPDGRPAVAHVESITLVTPGGELRRASRTAHRELFALAAGGQDLFGALYSVTLNIGSLQRAVNEAAAAEVIAAPEPDAVAAAAPAAAAGQGRCLPGRGAPPLRGMAPAAAGVERAAHGTKSRTASCAGRGANTPRSRCTSPSRRCSASRCARRSCARA